MSRSVSPPLVLWCCLLVHFGEGVVQSVVCHWCCAWCCPIAQFGRDVFCYFRSSQVFFVCFRCRLASMLVYFCEARSMRVMLKSEPFRFVGTKDATLLSEAANSLVYLFGSCWMCFEVRNWTSKCRPAPPLLHISF